MHNTANFSEKEQLAYWKQQFADAPQGLNLPVDHPRSAMPTYHGSMLTFAFPERLSNTLDSLSRQEASTLQTMLTAAFLTLLYRYTGQEDLLIGTTTSNGERPQVEKVTDNFPNVQVLRTDMSGNPTFLELMKRVDKVIMSARQHDGILSESFVKELEREHEEGHPSVEVMLSFQSQLPLPSQAQGRTMPQTDVSGSNAQFDLHLELDDQPGSITGRFVYNANLFEQATIARMLGHWQTLLEGSVVNPEQPLATLPLLTEDERQMLLVDWNQTQVLFPEACFPQLFEQQVERTPEAIAVVFEDQQLTYRDLNARANQLAHYLRRLGVGPETLVGICMERSPEMIVGLLGILKAGGAYVPLDPAYPQERLAFMLHDGHIAVVLTQQHLEQMLPLHDIQSICLDNSWKDIALAPTENPSGEVTPQHLAYVIYTSGSTGKPKGVMIHHQGLVNYLSWCTRAYDVEKGYGAPVHSSISFDLTITSLFVPLLVGQTVYLLSEQIGVGALGEALRSLPTFSFIKLTPAHLELLSQQVSPQAASEITQAFIIGGEQLTGSNVAFWQDTAPATTLINEYGPTETVVGCCVYQVPAGEHYSGPIPIGRPIANTRIYVLDTYLQPVPIGVPGELHIGGVGVARGYLNRPELTAERFIPDPFSHETGARLYKTGDLVRYLPDGNLEFLGRLDHQVKVRGFRIELGEVEAVLRQHQHVREAIVVAREDTLGDKRLVAYVILQEQQMVTVSDLQSHMMNLVPSYMVPTSIVVLDAFPVTHNGKVDRNVLPAPAATNRLRDETTAPASLIEEQVAEVMASLLGVEQIGRDDDFFMLGGHSLLGIELVIRLTEQFGVDLSLYTLFDAPTVRQLSIEIEQRVVAKLETIDEDEIRLLLE